MTFGSGVSPTKVKRSTVKILTRNISKTVTDYEVGPQGALDRRTHGLSIGTVRLTSDDLEWSKSTPKSENFGNAYLVDRLRDRAEIL